MRVNCLTPIATYGQGLSLRRILTTSSRPMPTSEVSMSRRSSSVPIWFSPKMSSWFLLLLIHSWSTRTHTPLRSSSLILTSRIESSSCYLAVQLWKVFQILSLRSVTSGTMSSCSTIVRLSCTVATSTTMESTWIWTWGQESTNSNSYNPTVRSVHPHFQSFRVPSSRDPFKLMIQTESTTATNYWIKFYFYFSY